MVVMPSQIPATKMGVSKVLTAFMAKVLLKKSIWKTALTPTHSHGMHCESLRAAES